MMPRRLIVVMICSPWLNYRLILFQKSDIFAEDEDALQGVGLDHGGTAGEGPTNML